MEYLEERRHLTAFDTAALPQVFCEVLIVGSGIAGLRAALSSAEHSDVLIVAKMAADENNTSHAQGGIAAAIGADDSVAAHESDTLAVGQGLCEADVVRLITEEAPRRIRELVEWGAQFDTENGAIALTWEGGHSTARIAHAQGDATGRELEDTLLRRVRGHEGIRILEEAFVLDLLTAPDHGCLGAVIHHRTQGRMVVWAKQTVLAGGGCGRIFRETTNPPGATGDGTAMAYRAGAVLADVEFYQFHPTALYIAGASRTLISEAVRGEGAWLLNARHERFMPNYDERAELAPRDTVSRAIVSEIGRTGHTCVYVDMRHIPPERLIKRFPAIRDFCAQYDIDITRDLVPVRPAAHYMIGGVRVDTEGRTSLPRLFACGEVACTGLHGANRLGSNSLLEGLVIGARAGDMAGHAAACERRDPAHPRVRSPLPPPKHAAIDVGDLTNALRAVAWRSLGIERSRFGLEEAAHMMKFWGRYVMDREFRDTAGWELQNMLLTARLIAQAALMREESRGVHYRNDFPERNDAQWQCHILLQKGREPETRPVSGSPHIR